MDELSQVMMGFYNKNAGIKPYVEETPPEPILKIVKETKKKYSKYDIEYENTEDIINVIIDDKPKIDDVRKLILKYIDIKDANM